MSDKKIPDLTGLGALSELDEIYIVDKSDTTDGVDGTSKKFQVGINSGLVGLTDSQTLTNKTLTSPAINGGTHTSAVHVAAITTASATSYTPAGGATATLDLTTANVHTITMPAGNITIAVSNETANKFFLVEITQDGGGSRTVTWFTTIRWADGTVPTLTTTASKRDVFGFKVTGTDTYDGYVVGQNI